MSDDPCDDLSRHRAVNAAEAGFRVYPTFREDSALLVEVPGTFNTWVNRLEEASNLEVSSLANFLDALRQRHDFFHANGGRLSDHGLAHCYATPCSERKAATIFAKARAGTAATSDEQEQFASFLMFFFGRLDAEKSWTKQLHLGAIRNVNTRMVGKAGVNTGFDGVGDWEQAAALCAYLDMLEQEHALPKTIVYNLNPADNYVFATAVGNFQDGSIAGKIQFGGGWWFLDQKESIEWQLNALSNTGLLSRFIGMLTDSRSFMSFPRHEYFRRVLCNLLGRDVENGELPNDEQLLGKMVRNVCFKAMRGNIWALSLRLLPRSATKLSPTASGLHITTMQLPRLQTLVPPRAPKNSTVFQCQVVWPLLRENGNHVRFSTELMKRCLHIAILGAVLFGGWRPEALGADTGQDAWLRYAPLETAAKAKYASLPASVVVLGHSPVLRTAQEEMIRGVRGMMAKTLRAEKGVAERAIVLGTLAAMHAAGYSLKAPKLEGDGFWLTTGQIQGIDCLIVASTSDLGVLYGVFALLSKIARDQTFSSLDEVQQPYALIRWVEQWDNLNGTIERGYAGPSIFFENGDVRADLRRVGQYARLLASIGVNGCTINNVNADPRIIDDSFLPQLARIANEFRPWGVRLAVSVDLSSPKVIGGLDSFDPVDPRVIEWWRAKVSKIYQQIPDFGGFVVKADSEGRPGPSSYGRTPADAATVIARALKPHGGLLLYRAFAYDHHLDWRNPKNDRARAAYDIFHPLDGQFDDNVIIQIKYGPIDFQAREPVSPLLGRLERTNEGIELQITQEYTGQQRHLCFLPTMWKEILDFDLHVSGNKTPVKDLVAGKVFHRPTGALVGVANVGLDANWLGHPLAMANLYGFGRLAWDPNLSGEAVAEEWTRLAFGNDPLVVKTITDMQRASWYVYESYTGPLGAQTLTDILGSHYGPGIESSERNGWGQWHRADHDGIGMDRTVATGTGYTGQYPPAIQNWYESVQATPDELLLFFHHVPYTYLLHSGKTVIQHIYDSHYDGAEEAADFVRQWKSLQHHVDEERYAAVLARLEYQAGHAIVWRDAICNWFFRTSGIRDAKGRVDHHPHRIEAETMQLQGYGSIEVHPWENASGGEGIECVTPSGCTATLRFDRPAGWYEIDVQYFDQNNGESKFRVFVGNQQVDEWIANDHFPATKPSGDSSTGRRIPGLALRPGDEIRVQGIPDGEEHAPLDYIEVRASPAER